MIGITLHVLESQIRQMKTCRGFARNALKSPARRRVTERNNRNNEIGETVYINCLPLKSLSQLPHR